jgi:hypothetical protein
MAISIPSVALIRLTGRVASGECPLTQRDYHRSPPAQYRVPLQINRTISLPPVSAAHDSPFPLSTTHSGAGSPFRSSFPFGVNGSFSRKIGYRKPSVETLCGNEDAWGAAKMAHCPYGSSHIAQAIQDDPVLRFQMCRYEDNTQKMRLVQHRVLSLTSTEYDLGTSAHKHAPYQKGMG